MDSASLSEVRKELQLLAPARLAELCVSLARYKKDNKEFLSFLLFDAHDKLQYVQKIKEEIDLQFAELGPASNLYYAKKSLRKILRGINKYAKYLGDKAHAASLHIYFLGKLKTSGIQYKKSQLLVNLYDQQIKKINTLVTALHEDLRADYINEMEEMNL